MERRQERAQATLRGTATTAAAEIGGKFIYCFDETQSRGSATALELWLTKFDSLAQGPKKRNLVGEGSHN